MNEEIYKVGDILEIPGNVVLPRQFSMYPKEETCRCLVLNVLYPGFDSISYTLLTYKDGFGTFNIVGVGHANIADCGKLIGHSDISALRYEKPEEGSGEPDYKMMIAAYSSIKASNLRHMLAAKESENVDLKNENAFLTHKLREAEAQRDKVKNERDDIEEKTRKLEEENEKLMQKISCADKLLAEAANRLYQGRAHLNITAHN